LCIPVIFLLKDNSKGKFFWNVVISLHVLAAFLTMSRTAFIVIPLIFFLYLFMNKKLKSILVAPIVVVFLISIFMYILNLFSLGNDFFNRMFFRSSEFSLIHRLNAFEAVPIL